MILDNLLYVKSTMRIISLLIRYVLWRCHGDINLFCTLYICQKMSRTYEVCLSSINWSTFSCTHSTIQYLSYSVQENLIVSILTILDINKNYCVFFTRGFFGLLINKRMVYTILLVVRLQKSPSKKNCFCASVMHGSLLKSKSSLRFVVN